MPEGGRVIAGTARGIRLEGAPAATRPLSDRVKESLFGALETEGALSDGFLDLFAGTGAAGIEALSRGATSATFVEHDSKVSAVIEANLKRAHLSGGRVVRNDVLRFLSTGRPEQLMPYRAAIADPPYDTPLIVPTLELLGNRQLGWMADAAVVVAKHFWRDTPVERIGSLALERQRRFGETMLTFYRQT
ncbi:MAG: 16S rRNA (guanine(966)-N(2))-methyltransferase RsmD, partial [Chloroflexota bacterium]